MRQLPLDHLISPLLSRSPRAAPYRTATPPRTGVGWRYVELVVFLRIWRFVSGVAGRIVDIGQASRAGPRIP